MSDQTVVIDPDKARITVFIYDLAVLAGLMALAVVFIYIQRVPDALKDYKDYLVPVEAMWFGALGGLMISLKGVYDHHDGTEPWDTGYNLWHYGRPFSGAVAGAVTSLLLTVLNPATSGSTAGPNSTIVFAAAFVFGTQESRFFNFLFEIAKLVVTVPEDNKPAGLQITDVQPATAATGAIVIVKGQGLAADATVKLGSVPLEKLTVASDGSSAAGVVPAKPVGVETVDVVVANPGGASFVLPAKFKFSS